jgi:signal transduction histidine kinase
MSDPVWYRSLYFRIAVGFVALLGALLVVQGSVFLWMTGRMTDFFPSRSPAQFASAIATDLATTLASTPDEDLAAYLNSHYASAYRPFAVALLDEAPRGDQPSQLPVMTPPRVIVSQRVSPPPNIVRSVSGRLFAETQLAGFSRGWPSDFGGPGRYGGDGFGRGGRDSRDGRGGRDDRDGRGGSRDGRDFRGGPGDFRGGSPGGSGRGDGGRGGFSRGGAGPTFEYAPVIVNATTVGMVAVPIEPPPLSVALRDLGPTLAIVALGLLVAGTAVGALVVVRPVHRRLHDLQQTARRLGDGETAARALETGRDEVTALARTFNEMAGQLEERTRALETADRTRRQLLADVSHELTTPLASIRGYVETLGMPDLRIDAAMRARYLQIVSEEAQRLDHIVGDLLDLAKLEGGGGALRMEQVSVAQLLERVQDRHEPAVRDRHITLLTDSSPDVPVIYGDSKRIEQAVQNLVANAVRHTPDGGQVAVRVSAVERGVSLVVDDSGPGIPAEHLPRIFDRFYKVDASRTGTVVPSGSGLGLSIVQAIVARHGGSVEASNVQGRGARFEIILPSPVTGGQSVDAHEVPDLPE